MNRTRTLYFEKAHKDIDEDPYSFTVISDSSVIERIKVLCNRYNSIQLKSVNLVNRGECRIKIKSDKETFIKFCIDLCEILEEYIRKVHF